MTDRLVVAAQVRSLGSSFHAAALASSSYTSKAAVAAVLGVDRANYTRWANGSPVSLDQIARWVADWPRGLVLICTRDRGFIVAPVDRLAAALQLLHLTTTPGE